MQMRRLIVICALSIVLSAWTNGEAQQLIWIAPSNAQACVAEDVSDDGQYVVGFYSSSGIQYAFVWAQNSGIANLSTLGGRDARAFGISPNGRYIVGWAMDPTFATYPTVWTAPAFTPIAIRNIDGIAFKANDDGLVVGYYGSNSVAFVWDINNLTLTDLGHLGGNFSQAYSISNHPTNPVVVGRSFTPTQDHAFIYKLPNGPMTSLGTLGGPWSWGLGVSDDGQVVVGISWLNSPHVQHAFRWTQQTGMVDLGAVPGGDWSEAYDCDASGDTVVGRGSDSQGYLAFRWTSASGMEDLNQTYASLLSNGSRLESATAISGDGCFIVGQGLNAATGRREAFLLITCCTEHNGDVDRNGCVDDADLLAVLFAFGSSGQNLGRVDVNCDAVVDDADLLLVLFNFGSGC